MQVREVSAFERVRTVLPPVHSRLWITVWTEPCTSVDSVVDNDVHNTLGPRRRGAS